jgi:hypothetical protein
VAGNPTLGAAEVDDVPVGLSPWDAVADVDDVD